MNTSCTGDRKIAIIGTHYSGEIKTFLEANGYPTTINPTSLNEFDIAILMRRDGNDGLRNWVLNGGYLITEWSASKWALNTANLLPAIDLNLDITDSENAQHVKIRPWGVALGFADGLSCNPYFDAQRTQFFREFAFSTCVDYIGQRVLDLEPAIFGGRSGQGQTLVIGYDWSDGFNNSVENDPDTPQLLLNALNYGYRCVEVLPNPVGDIVVNPSHTITSILTSEGDVEVTLEVDHDIQAFLPFTGDVAFEFALSADALLRLGRIWCIMPLNLDFRPSHDADFTYNFFYEAHCGLLFGASSDASFTGFFVVDPANNTDGDLAIGGEADVEPSALAFYAVGDVALFFEQQFADASFTKQFCNMLFVRPKVGEYRGAYIAAITVCNRDLKQKINPETMKLKC